MISMVGTGHRLDDVAGTYGIAVRHVLDQADHPDDIDLGLAQGQRLHEADNGGRTAHIALHVLHVDGRLDRDAARIEADTLADKGDGRDRPSCRHATA